MTVKEMKELLADLPDEAPLEIFNSSYEWYGIEPIDAGHWQLIDGRLVLHFGGDTAWENEYEEINYQREKNESRGSWLY